MFRVRRLPRSPSPLDVEIVELTFEVSPPGRSPSSCGAAEPSLSFDGVRRLGRSAGIQLAMLAALVGTMVVLAQVPGQATRLDMAASGEPTTTGSISAPTLRPTLTWDAPASVAVELVVAGIEP